MLSQLSTWSVTLILKIEEAYSSEVLVFISRTAGVVKDHRS
jgi:hypothetical protein